MTDPSVNNTDAECRTSLSLLALVKAQDQSAWERLVTLYSPLVYRWGRRVGLQEADAADLGQEVFRAVARKIGDFRREREGDSFRRWLRAIFRNKLSDLFRARRAETPGIGGDGAQQFWQQLPDLTDPLDDETLAEETGFLYRRALALIASEFEERSWQAFWRVAVENQAAADVAHDLNMTVNAVYLAKSRILHRLRSEFADLVET